MNRTPLVVAHRGFTRDHEENTIPALSAAVVLGVDMVEFDIHETRDHEFVVFHNDRPTRTSPRWGKIDYADIGKYVRATTQPPRLSDYLQAAGQLPLYVEPKRILHSSCLISYLKKNPLPKGSVVGSSHKKLLADLHEGTVNYPLLLSVHPKTYHVLRVMPGMLFGKLPMSESWQFLAGFSLHRSIATRAFISTLLAHGKQVYVWTVNAENRMKELQEQGVTAIISDKPDLLLHLRQNHARSAAARS